MRYLGVDVGGTSVKIAAVEGARVAWTGQSPFYARPTTEQLINAINAAAAGRADRADGVGLCVPGLQDKVARKVILSVNVPGLNNVSLDELIRTSLGEGVGRVQIVNDAVATGTDVFLSNKLSGRLLTIALGTGVGGGVLDDGAPLIIEGESSGHIGQFDVSIEGHPVVGPDGGAGSLEGYMGVAALRQRYGADADLNTIIAKWTGDEPPLRALARSIRIAHAVYRPHHVVLAGGVGIRLKHLIPKIRALIEDKLTSVAREGWTLSTGDSDFHAAAGAAKVAMRRKSDV
jgi:glucokinase